MGITSGTREIREPQLCGHEYLKLLSAQNYCNIYSQTPVHTRPIGELWCIGRARATHANDLISVTSVIVTI